MSELLTLLLLYKLYWASLVAQMAESACHAGDLGLIPGLGRFSEGGHDNPLQYSCLENPHGQGVWWAAVPGVAKNRTRLSDYALLKGR